MLICPRQARAAPDRVGEGRAKQNDLSFCTADFLTHREIPVLLLELVQLHDLSLVLVLLVEGDEDASVAISLLDQLLLSSIELVLNLLEGSKSQELS